jgi:hypothetical protein
MVAAVDFDLDLKTRGHRPHPAAKRTRTAPRLRQSLAALGSGYGLNERKIGYAQKRNTLQAISFAGWRAPSSPPRSTKTRLFAPSGRREVVPILGATECLKSF